MLLADVTVGGGLVGLLILILIIVVIIRLLDRI